MKNYQITIAFVVRRGIQSLRGTSYPIPVAPRVRRSEARTVHTHALCSATQAHAPSVTSRASASPASAARPIRPSSAVRTWSHSHVLRCAPGSSTVRSTSARGSATLGVVWPAPSRRTWSVSVGASQLRPLVGRRSSSVVGRAGRFWTAVNTYVNQSSAISK